MDMVSWYPYSCKVTKLNMMLEEKEMRFKSFPNSF